MHNRFLFLIYLISFLFAGNPSFANKTDKELIEKNLTTAVYSLDSEAAAIILFEKRAINISRVGSKCVQTENVHKIIKVLKPDGVKAANFNVFVSADDADHYVNNIKGTTWNINAGNIVETGLEKKDVYRKKISDKLYETSFSMPSVKEGSVFEISYDVIIPMETRTTTWHIQEEYTKLVSEFEFIYPATMEFTVIRSVGLTAKEYSSEDEALAGQDSFCEVMGNGWHNNGAQHSACWIRKNVDAITPEPYVQNMKNQLERIELQLSGYMSSANSLININNSWSKINDILWEQQNMRKEVRGSNKYLDAVTDSITKKDASSLVNAKNIYAYVRSGFTCDHDKSFLPKKSLESVFENKGGNESELNLLLAAMLVHAGLDAAPLLLGTSDKISPTEVFPVLDRFNYIACTVMIDGTRIFLDGSDKNNCFGILPVNCYNGYAWVLGNNGSGVMLTHDMITDRAVTSVRISGFTDSSAKVEITEKLGLVNSAALRKTWAADNTGEDAFLMAKEKEIGDDVTILESKIDNTDLPDTNLVSKYVCTMKFAKNVNRFYFNALFVKLFDANPFKSAIRKFPVEFPYKTDLTYYMTIVLPPNMGPDTLPDPAKVSYNGSDILFTNTFGYFADMHSLSVRANYTVNNTSFAKEDYQTLRYFYQKVMDANKAILTVKKTQ